MRHADFICPSPGIRHALTRLLLLTASLLGAVVAQEAAPAPYNLCVRLNDSSGKENGLHVFNCGATAMSETQESNTFSADLATAVSTGTAAYLGTARASSDAFDTVKLYASAQLTNYLPQSYVATPSGGIEFAASAEAHYSDTVTIAGPAGPAVLHLSFSVTGTPTEAGASAQLCYGFAYGGPINGGPCALGLPSVITFDSEPFVPSGTPQPLNFQFSAVVFKADGGMTDPYSASASADLEHTITMQELLVTTPGGLPIAGINLSSAGGFDYPLSPLNQVPAIPEPGSAVLTLAALGLLGLRQMSKRPVKVGSPSTPLDRTASR